MLFVEGHFAIPYRVELPNWSKEAFEKLSKEEQRLVVQAQGRVVAHGGIQYCASVLDSYESNETS